MDKLNIYEWSIKDQNCFSPYSTSYIQLWALQPNLLLCYRLINNAYTVDRECCLIDLTTNQTCLINRKRLEELNKLDKAPNIERIMLGVDNTDTDKKYAMQSIFNYIIFFICN